MYELFVCKHYVLIIENLENDNNIVAIANKKNYHAIQYVYFMIIPMHFAGESELFI